MLAACVCVCMKEGNRRRDDSRVEGFSFDSVQSEHFRLAWITFHFPFQPIIVCSFLLKSPRPHTHALSLSLTPSLNLSGDPICDHKDLNIYWGMKTDRRGQVQLAWWARWKSRCAVVSLRNHMEIHCGLISRLRSDYFPVEPILEKGIWGLSFISFQITTLKSHRLLEMTCLWGQASSE